MTKKQPRPRMSNQPQEIDSETTWYYEHGREMSLVHYLTDGDGKRTQGIVINIPWKLVEASVDRRRAVAKDRASQRLKK